MSARSATYDLLCSDTFAAHMNCRAPRSIDLVKASGVGLSQKPTPHTDTQSAHSGHGRWRDE